jgi:hypothetical protein
VVARGPRSIDHVWSFYIARFSRVMVMGSRRFES